MEKPQVYEGTEPYIFVSYAHAISERAFKIIRLLSSAGYRLWYDEGLVVGKAYADLIAEKIEKCSVFLCLLTNDYGESAFCRYEFNFALEILHKECIPLYLDEIENVTLPGGIRMRLAGIHAVEVCSDREQILSALKKSRSAYACLEKNAEFIDADIGKKGNIQETVNTRIPEEKPFDKGIKVSETEEKKNSKSTKKKSKIALLFIIILVVIAGVGLYLNNTDKSNKSKSKDEINTGTDGIPKKSIEIIVDMNDETVSTTE